MWVNALFKRRHKRNLSVRSHYSEQPPSAERNKMAEEDLCYVYVDFNRYPKAARKISGGGVTYAVLKCQGARIETQPNQDLRQGKNSVFYEIPRRSEDMDGNGFS
uniref:Uncharacterized protein n=1 Tax=Xenopus tropicalis TaxID=8364 RepID=A0A1B8Y5Y8_XENTR